MTFAGLPYNTLVVAVGVAAVGFAAGVVGSLCVLRKLAFPAPPDRRLQGQRLQCPDA